MNLSLEEGKPKKRDFFKLPTYIIKYILFSIFTLKKKIMFSLFSHKYKFKTVL